MAIVNELMADTLPGAYTFSSEVKATLRNLVVVSFACNEWFTPLLYSRVTVAEDQISRLIVTLSSTLRGPSLAKRIHTLRLSVPFKESYTPNIFFDEWTDNDMDVADAAALLHLLSPYATLKRLFVDMALTHRSIYKAHPSNKTLNLQNAIGTLASLSELVLGNMEEPINHFFWMIELNEDRYDCLKTLRTLTILDVNVVWRQSWDILPQLVNLEELVLIRPWMSPLGMGGEVLAEELFGPVSALRRLTFVLACGWGSAPVQTLKVEDLGVAMVPYRDMVDVVPSSEAQGSLPSWKTIRDMIGMGRDGDNFEYFVGNVPSQLAFASLQLRSPVTPSQLPVAFPRRVGM
ncbi:hypothetical protein FRB95_006952 [Tulasnella sp. JGI-2019a]|nr:hypothetical protein FRB95_006952 [Tulasnella sp. JGI-2019a]